MPNTLEQDRVLNRLGARLLQPREMEQVTGGIRTSPCTFNPSTVSFDGDCPREP